MTTGIKIFLFFVFCLTLCVVFLSFNERYINHRIEMKTIVIIKHVDAKIKEIDTNSKCEK